MSATFNIFYVSIKYLPLLHPTLLKQLPRNVMYSEYVALEMLKDLHNFHVIIEVILLSSHQLILIVAQEIVIYFISLNN